MFVLKHCINTDARRPHILNSPRWMLATNKALLTIRIHQGRVENIVTEWNTGESLLLSNVYGNDVLLQYLDVWLLSDQSSTTHTSYNYYTHFVQYSGIQSSKTARKLCRYSEMRHRHIVSVNKWLKMYSWDTDTSYRSTSAWRCAYNLFSADFSRSS